MPRPATTSQPPRQRGPAEAGRAPLPGLLSARTAVPLLAEGTLARPALERRLDSATRRRLTVVAAGPGWGKTTAVAAWASTRQDLRVAWLTVEANDDSPAVFWSEVLVAVLRSGAVPEGHPLHEIGQAGTASSQALGTIVQGLASLPEPFLLVLDDFHLIEDPAVLESLEALVRYELPVRLVLVTRIDPGLHLHRLRLAGELTELYAAELAFGADEVRALAAARSVNLTTESVDLLLARTEGWPAGVQLAMLYLTRSGGDRDPSGFAGNDQSVAEYLLAEVLEHQPVEVRDFLLRTSVVSPVSAELAEALAPGHTALPRLRALVRSHQFVTALGPDGHWFRYHPLLREMLVGLLRRSDPAAYRDAQGRAARWLAEHDEPVQALRHAAESDWSLFAELFVTSGAPGLIGTQRTTVAELLEQIPAEDVDAAATLSLCAAGLAVARGRFRAAETHVERARVLEPGTGPDLRPAVRVLLEVLDCACARAAGDMPRLVRSGRRALRHLDEAPWPYPAMPAYHAVAANNAAVGMLWTGDLEGAKEAFTDVLDVSGGAATLAAVNALAHLSVCELVECRLGRAEDAAAEALLVARRGGWTAQLQLRPAHLTLASVRALRGDDAGADQALAAALAATIGGVEPAAVLLSRVVQVLVAVSRGRLRAARHALRSAEEAAAGWSVGPFLTDQLCRARTEVELLAVSVDPQGEAAAPAADVPSPTGEVSRARLRLAAGDAGAAHLLAEGVTASPTRADPGELVTQVEAWLVRALAAHQLRRDGRASSALGRAVELARRERLVRPFVVMSDAGLVTLLRRQVSQREADGFTRRLLALAVGGEDADHEPEPEPLLVALTDRELAILAALPSMQSNAEIAADYYVSVNTVKAHLKALYRKLDVSSRRDAVRRGRELGLLG